MNLGNLTVYIDADYSDAMKGVSKVEAEMRRLARSTGADVAIGADTSTVDSALSEVMSELRRLEALDPQARVSADTSLLETAIASAASELRRLDGSTATVTATADTSAATSALSDVGEAGEAAGAEAGEGLSDGIVAALTALPIAGSVVGIGAAIGAALVSGLEQEVQRDALAARTGLSPEAVGRIGRAAGDAYAANFGSSTAENLETARIALGAGLLDPDATVSAGTQIISTLQGIADVMQTDVLVTAQAVARMLDTGLVSSADEAYDVLVAGLQTTGDLAGDLTETFGEYAAGFAPMGLSGAQAMGLIGQAIRGGVKDTDAAADSIREFGRIAREEPERAAAAFQTLGVDVAGSLAAMQAGGPGAVTAMDAVLDALRGVVDPAEQARLSVQLFGDMAGDYGTAWAALDLSTAVTELGTLEGAAQTAIDTMGDNAAGSIETAKRNIQTAADGITGALAVAFGPQIEGFAQTVTENREAVIDFLLAIANGGLDAGRALVEAGAAGIESFGEMVATVGPAVFSFLRDLVAGIDEIPGVDMSDSLASIESMQLRYVDSMLAFEEESASAADSMRESLITNGIDPIQDRLNAVGDGLLVDARLHDAAVALTSDLDAIGTAADGSTLALDATSGSIDVTTAAGSALDAQLRAAAAGMTTAAEAGAAAGESTDDLTASFAASREALVTQLTALGFTTEAANALADSYGAVPDIVTTAIETEGLDRARQEAEAYRQQLDRLDGRRITTTIIGNRPANIQADTAFAGGGLVLSAQLRRPARRLIRIEIPQ